MKIDNTGKAISTYASQPKPVRGPAKADEAAKASSSESVDINPVASQMSEPAFDASKVEAIKQAISSGQFKVNPEAIADGLIKTARELIGG
jgi:negative regulator of flagellin synthesis FlgM